MNHVVTPRRPLRLLVVDDHEVVHWGLRIMLDRFPWIERSYSARDSAEAVDVCTRHPIDLALIDLFVGAESGPDICERLHKVRPGIRVLLISGAGHISARAAAACGASGFVSKDWRGTDIVRAVATVAAGGSVFEDDGQSASPLTASLSERERQILTHLAAGATNREIAAALELSRHTVKEYVSAVYRKLEVRNRLEAVRRGEKLGLLD